MCHGDLTGAAGDGVGWAGEGKKYRREARGTRGTPGGGTGPTGRGAGQGGSSWLHPGVEVRRSGAKVVGLVTLLRPRTGALRGDPVKVSQAKSRWGAVAAGHRGIRFGSFGRCEGVWGWRECCGWALPQPRSKGRRVPGARGKLEATRGAMLRAPFRAGLGLDAPPALSSGPILFILSGSPAPYCASGTLPPFPGVPSWLRWHTSPALARNGIHQNPCFFDFFRFFPGWHCSCNSEGSGNSQNRDSKHL